MQVRLWHENSPLASVVNLCHNAVTHNIPCNLHFFVNSVDFIGRVLHHARLSPDEVKIVCSTSGTSEQINREKLGGDYSIGIPDKAVRKINFYTSTAFEGCDIFDKTGRTYIVSDGTATHSMLDVASLMASTCNESRFSRVGNQHKTKIQRLYSLCSIMDNLLIFMLGPLKLCLKNLFISPIFPIFKLITGVSYG